MLALEKLGTAGGQERRMFGVTPGAIWKWGV
jgi:hypothetical protein